MLVASIAVPEVVDAAVTWPLSRRVIGRTFDCEGKYFRVRPGDYYEGCTFLACAGVVIPEDEPDVYFCRNHVHFRRQFFVEHPFIATEREVNEAWARQAKGYGLVPDPELGRIYGDSEPGPEYIN